jgi:hypothetical protein
MIRARLTDGQEIGIGFSYITLPQLLSKTMKLSEARTTVCKLYGIGSDGKPATVLASDDAACSASDNFRKETGRKIALTRAIEKAKLSKQDRRLVWEAYFGRGVTD